ncbi:MAG: ATP-dependent sacrificial sulfur transferase LarE [Oscillospiraceae bacterium]|nr:ATP-dependent sacrificial sulfur transferase LarE [Oscillospiraceae bacterium]
MDSLHEKFNDLQNRLLSMQSVAVAFSGGVDSTFLLKTAHDVLDDRAMAVTAVSCFLPECELAEASEFCKAAGIRQTVVTIQPLAVPGIRENPADRCYLCKHAIFERLWQITRNSGFLTLAEGSNTDDENDYRPGMIAVKELAVASPLRDAGLTKADIRILSRELSLPTWDKPSLACLASRFVYGEALEEEKLLMVDRAEHFLRNLGFRQVRVRVHGRIARIELLPADFLTAINESCRESICMELKRLGFDYVTLDLTGYRTGSMNEVLKK